MKKLRPFVEIVVERRKAMGMSQKDLGKRVGRSQSAVSAWENGANRIALDEFYPVARVLGLSEAEIMEAVRVEAVRVSELSEPLEAGA